MRGDRDAGGDEPSKDGLGPGLTLILGTLLICAFLLAVILLFKP